MKNTILPSYATFRQLGLLASSGYLLFITKPHYILQQQNNTIKKHILDNNKQFFLTSKKSRIKLHCNMQEVKRNRLRCQCINNKLRVQVGRGGII